MSSLQDIFDMQNLLYSTLLEIAMSNNTYPLHFFLTKVLQSQADLMFVLISMTSLSIGPYFFYTHDNLFRNVEKNKLDHYVVQFQLSSCCIYLIGAYNVHNIF